MSVEEDSADDAGGEHEDCDEDHAEVGTHASPAAPDEKLGWGRGRGNALLIFLGRLQEIKINKI